jgi:hypothetical protein
MEPQAAKNENYYESAGNGAPDKIGHVKDP